MMIERVDIYFKTTADGVYELVSLPYSPRTTRAQLAQEFETHLKEKLCFTAYAGFELKKPSKVFIEAFNDGKELPMDELVTLPTVSIIQNHLPTEGCLFANLHYLPPPRPRPPILTVHSRSSQNFNAEDLQLNVVIEHTSSEIPKVVEDFMKGAVQSRAVTQEDYQALSELGLNELFHVPDGEESIPSFSHSVKEHFIKLLSTQLENSNIHFIKTQKLTPNERLWTATTLSIWQWGCWRNGIRMKMINCIFGFPRRDGRITSR
ncbi:hypothetical protein BT96DRAFT_263372 [Gymnopus androsaceus JB14]|uniref:Uncharacterized protein n=1 Tax=Gymnopus androsaceus JB14 TaxID=1447944 RepID=A0A6A4H4Q4_9AGAR|nr:hypothetical protein BT96DRAFT_263372 [Gymnopus androsaceus JB14]